MPRTIDETLKAELIKAENEPVYLVEIALTGVTLRFAQSKTDIVFPTGGNTYYAWGMSFDKVRSTMTDEVDRKKITFDNTNLLFSTTYLAVYNFQGKVLTLKRICANLLSSSLYAMTVFAGECGAPTANEEEVEFEVISPFYKLDRVFPGRKFQPSCQYVFDSAECLGGGSSLADTTTGTADSGDYENLVHTLRTEADNYWAGGVLTITSGLNNGIKRPIKSSTQLLMKITLAYPFPNEITTGTTYSIKRGCSKTSRDCKFKFANWENFGGFSTLPVKE